MDRCSRIAGGPQRERMKDDTGRPPDMSDSTPPEIGDDELYERWQEMKREFGEERWKLYSSGLLEYQLFERIPRWLEELTSRGLAGGKNRSPADVPQESGAALVEASDGRKVWIRPGAYRDEEGHLRTEVREHYSRTDGAIWAMLAVLEGGEGTAGERRLKRALREDYEILHALRNSKEPAEPANERLLMLAEATARHLDPDLDSLPERKHREVVLGFAERLSNIAKATRELQEWAEGGRLGKKEIRPRCCGGRTARSSRPLLGRNRTKARNTAKGARRRGPIR